MQIDFYLLQQYNSRERFVCRLLEKAYAQYYRCYVFCQNEVQAQQLDNLLWVYKDISFLPHAPYTPEDTLTPIQIAHPACPVPQWQDSDKRLLVNLNETTPDFFRQFERVAEVVAQWDGGQLAQGRARYRQYSQLNLNPNKPHMIP